MKRSINDKIIVFEEKKPRKQMNAWMSSGTYKCT